MLSIDLVKLVIMLRDTALSIAGLMGAVFHAVGWWSGEKVRLEADCLQGVKISAKPP
jgi:hypothetical protein